MFSRIARRYDLANTVLSLGRDAAWRRRAVERVVDRSGLVVLDLCAGTGKVAFACAEARNRPRLTIASDFAEAMLEVGRRQCGRRRLEDRVQFLCLDALRVPLADATCDVVTCAFGARNLVDLEQGLREAARCLRPGGTLLILEFMHPGKRWTRRAVSWYIRRVIPVLGGLIAGAPAAYRYLRDSIDAFLTREEMAALLRRCGFASVEAIDYTLGICTAFYATRE